MSIVKKVLKFLKEASSCFCLGIIVLAIFGYFGGVEMDFISSLVHADGVTYQGIFQFALFSFFVTLINTILDHPAVLPNMRMIYKLILRIVLILLAIVPFIAYGHWFPIDHAEAWISFILTFGICILVSTILSVILTRKKDKEYEALLRGYKTRHRR